MKKAAAICGAVLSIGLQSASADQLEYTFYRIDDNLENSVTGTSFNLAESLWRRAMLLLDIEMDQTYVPPLVGDATSGASRPARHKSEPFRKNRGQLIIGLEQGLGDNTSVTGSFYQSREVDYFSNSVIGSIRQELFQKNLTVELRGQYTADSVGEIPEAGGLINRFKETHQVNLAISQLLSPVMILRFGGDGIRNRGFLSDPYRKDNHPSIRWRQAGWIDINRYLNRVHGALSGNYRYYWDDWNIASQAVKMRFSKYLGENVILSPEYRYYIQSGVNFKTSDPKLQAFDANTIEGELTWMLRGLGEKYPNVDFLTGTTLSLMYFRYWKSDGYGSNVWQGRVKFEF